MSIEFNQLRELLQQQQKQFEEAQLKLIESLTQRLHIQTAAASTATCYLTSCAKLDLMGLDWIEKLNLLEKPINSICNLTHAAPGDALEQTHIATRSLEDLSGAASAKKPTPHKIGQEFETLAGPASSPDLIGRKSGPNSQS
ncbi:hypothetical protein CLF_103182 [Clonorchis sinensis]|uniref:Uncharacterized protein n=1 Tax=Clonorchis sinensis TaxID=79923 RepID=G7Y986_CLOSI|nr:hypothetical protein CLF_103182 [Clonorchis sinensis]